MARPGKTLTVAADNGGDIRIGGRLRHARLMKGISLKEVAAGVGCSESFVSKLENDRVQPSLAVLHRLVALLGINVAAMFDRPGQHDGGPLFIMRAGERPTITTRLRQKADRGGPGTGGAGNAARAASGQHPPSCAGRQQPRADSACRRGDGLRPAGHARPDRGQSRQPGFQGRRILLSIGRAAWLRKSGRRGCADPLGQYPSDILADCTNSSHTMLKQVA